jgi:hypothetical protein
MSLTKGRCTAFAIFLIAIFGMEMALSVRQLSQTFRLGGASKTDESYRLFMAPGMGHCGGSQ